MTAKGPYLRADEAAKYLGLSKSRMAKLRMTTSPQKGPPFYKFAGVVTYRQEDLDAFAERHFVAATEA